MPPEARTGPEDEPSGTGNHTSDSRRNSISKPPPGWPARPDAAFYGPAGDAALALAPHTEADDVAVLVSLLVSLGNAVGRDPHIIADGARHTARLDAVLVGETSRARKGSAQAQCDRTMQHVDADWFAKCTGSGLASGEGLIAALADRQDKRLRIVESEFARALIAAGRQGSTLSEIIRQAWDGDDLRVLTRTQLVVDGAHISLLGHITKAELRKQLTTMDMGNGFANRMLFVLARRSRLNPRGDTAPDSLYIDIAKPLSTALEAFRRLGRFRRTNEAEERWAEIYDEIAAADPGGLVGAITARGEAQVLRLSLVYAGLDQSDKIDLPHLEAAYALWGYSESSAMNIFGDSVGHACADRLLEALRAIHPQGLDGTQQRDLFSRHADAHDLDAARALLEERGLAKTMKQDGTGGRPRLVTYAILPHTATEAT